MSQSDLFISCMVAHLLGDYIFQNDWMAEHKKKKSWVCMVHIACYSVGFVALLLSGELPLWVMTVILITHFLQDRTGFVVWFMRTKGSAKFVAPPCGPWSVIVVDNILHVLVIFFVIYVLMPRISAA